VIGYAESLNTELNSMNIKLSLVAPALVLLLPVGAAMAQDDLAACTGMLETAVGVALQSEGLDTTNACDLTVSQLAQIKNLLEQDGMQSRDRIQVILRAAADE